MPDKDHIIAIIFRYMTSSLTEEERKELSAWKEASEENRVFFEKLTSKETFMAKKEIYGKVNPGEAYQVFLKHTRKGRYRKRWIKVIGYAAIWLLLVCVGVMFYPQEASVGTVAERIEVGSSKAVLLMSGGKSVYLDDFKPDVRDLPSYVEVVDSNSQLIYQEKGDTVREYHELQVSRGGEYKLTLPDGTFVYINSASTLKYPTRFDGDKREVYLSGEAYFEVTKDVEKPFYVVTDHIRVKVYGTAFNINTHDPDYTRAVLVEGKVGVNIVGKCEEMILTPSRMAVFDKKRNILDVQDVNVQQYVAWKDGLFVFEDERLEKIMDKLALWYDCQVFYLNQKSRDICFTGYLKRYDEIDHILTAIASTVSVSFEINGKTIVVN